MSLSGTIATGLVAQELIESPKEVAHDIGMLGRTSTIMSKITRDYSPSPTPSSSHEKQERIKAERRLEEENAQIFAAHEKLIDTVLNADFVEIQKRIAEIDNYELESYPKNALHKTVVEVVFENAKLSSQEKLNVLNLLLSKGYFSLYKELFNAEFFVQNSRHRDKLTSTYGFEFDIFIALLTGENVEKSLNYLRQLVNYFLQNKRDLSQHYLDMWQHLSDVSQHFVMLMTKEKRIIIFKTLLTSAENATLAFQFVKDWINSFNRIEDIEGVVQIIKKEIEIPAFLDAESKKHYYDDARLEPFIADKMKYFEDLANKRIFSLQFLKLMAPDINVDREQPIPFSTAQYTVSVEYYKDSLKRLTSVREVITVYETLKANLSVSPWSKRFFVLAHKFAQQHIIAMEIARINSLTSASEIICAYEETKKSIQQSILSKGCLEFIFEAAKLRILAIDINAARAHTLGDNKDELKKIAFLNTHYKPGIFTLFHPRARDIYDKIHESHQLASAAQDYKEELTKSQKSISQYCK